MKVKAKLKKMENRNVQTQSWRTGCFSRQCFSKDVEYDAEVFNDPQKSRTLTSAFWQQWRTTINKVVDLDNPVRME